VSEANIRSLTGISSKPVNCEPLLQPVHFSSNFNPERCGLLGAISPTLLDGYLEKHGIEAELCELNVYSKGSQFTGFEDIPVNERMFASLTVVFPARHEGGNLLLRHCKDEWSVDFMNLLNDNPIPCIAYAVSFCGVEQTLSPIISGHCISLKYRLYIPDICKPSSLSSITTWNELAFRHALSDLLSNPSFLPSGGKVGHYLRYHYPVSVSKDRVSVSSALPPLKGIDAVFMHVCKEFSLPVTPSVVYNTSRALVMSDIFYPHEWVEYDSKVLIENGH